MKVNGYRTKSGFIWPHVSKTEMCKRGGTFFKKIVIKYFRKLKIYLSPFKRSLVLPI